MGNEQNNSNIPNPENQNFNNSNNYEHPQGAHPYKEHHHGSHHHHGCGIHVGREPFMCSEKFCAQRLIFKVIKILFALGVAFMIFVSGVVVGAHIGSRRSGAELRFHQLPYERSIKGSRSSQQYEIRVEPSQRTEKEYFFRFGN